MYANKEHQNSVYAMHKNSDGDSSFGPGIGQHASALITLLQ